MNLLNISANSEVIHLNYSRSIFCIITVINLFVTSSSSRISRQLSSSHSLTSNLLSDTFFDCFGALCLDFLFFGSAPGFDSESSSSVKSSARRFFLEGAGGDTDGGNEENPESSGEMTLLNNNHKIFGNIVDPIC